MTLKSIQYRPGPLDGFAAETGLVLQALARQAMGYCTVCIS
jgi:hypothetical protein